MIYSLTHGARCWYRNFDHHDHARKGGLMRELIDAGLGETEPAPVVNLADAHRAIDRIANVKSA